MQKWVILIAFLISICEIRAEVKNPNRIHSEHALRLAIERFDPTGAIGLQINSMQTQIVLAFLNGTLKKFSDELVNIPFYTLADHYQQLQQPVVSSQDLLNINKNLTGQFVDCAQEHRQLQISRKNGPLPGDVITYESIYYLDPINSPSLSCQRHAAFFHLLGIAEIRLHHSKNKGELSLHSLILKDLRQVARQIAGHSHWGKLMNKLEPAPYPRQHEYYEDQVQWCPNQVGDDNFNLCLSERIHELKEGLPTSRLKQFVVTGQEKNGEWKLKLQHVR